MLLFAWTPQPAVNQVQKDNLVRGVIHQSYFLPWLGYFSKLAFTDVFIVLDNVNFRKRFYHDRARIIDMDSNLRWIGLPVGENFRAKCNQVILHDSSCIDRVLATLAHSYARAPFVRSELPTLENAMRAAILPGKNLVDINLELILWVFQYLDIAVPRVVFASSFGASHDATGRLIQLIDAAGVGALITGGGSGGAVHDWTKLRNAGIRLLVQNYMAMHPTYRQIRRQHMPFEKGLSIVDALLSVGAKEVRRFIVDPCFAPIPM